MQKLTKIERYNYWSYLLFCNYLLADLFDKDIMTIGRHIYNRDMIISVGTCVKFSKCEKLT